jgi:hypothetical protein
MLFLERISCNLAFELNSIKSSSAYRGYNTNGAKIYVKEIQYLQPIDFI